MGKVISQIGGLRVRQVETTGHDSRTIINYQDLAKYVSQYYDANPVETHEEKSARELREKAIKRNEKIDKLLGNND